MVERWKWVKGGENVELCRRWRIRGGEGRALAKGVRVLWRGRMRRVEHWRR